MIEGLKLAVVLPAYNAGHPRAHVGRIPSDWSTTSCWWTTPPAWTLPSPPARHPYVVHPRNRGYGANQKSCYTVALNRGADIAIMLHPDYQYSPQADRCHGRNVASDDFDAVLGSRILGSGALTAACRATSTSPTVCSRHSRTC